MNAASQDQRYWHPRLLGLGLLAALQLGSSTLAQQPSASASPGTGGALLESSIPATSGSLSDFNPDALSAETYEGNMAASAPVSEDEASGWRIGSFTVNPSITISEAYDDNVFAIRNSKEADFFTIISPQITMSAQGEKYELDLYGTFDAVRYAQFSKEDYDNYSVGGDGSFAFDPDFEVFGGGAFRQDHESRESPDDVSGIFPTPFTSGQAFAGLYKRFNRVTTRIGGTFERLDFDDVPSSLGVIDNRDRDRDLYTAGARVGYWLDSDNEIFAQGSYDQRDYRLPLDDFGFARSSEGYAAAAGYHHRIPGRLDAELHLGYLEQNYRDPALRDVSTPDFGGRLSWQASPETRIRAFVDRSVRETTQPSASGFVSSGGRLGFEHAVRHNLLLNADASYFVDDYQGTTRMDRVSTISAGLRYYFTRHLFLGTDYAYVQRDSNIPREDYQKNVVFVRLGAQALPAYTRAARRSEMEDSSHGISRFYGGVQGGVTHVGTELEGTRGAGGSLTVDFAGVGADAGIFGGYGTTFDDWYLGLEMELESSDARWGHANVPLGRVFSVQKDSTLGGGLLFGYRLPSHSMLYGRFGAMVTELKTDYITAGERQKLSEGLLGLGGGVGAEVPLGDNLFFRLEYRYTAYEDYDLIDNFANNANSVRFGLGYAGSARGDDSAGPRKARTMMDFHGAYLGGQLGMASITSELRGARESGRNLSADFGDDGVMAGLYGGYGWTLLPLFLGVELEAETSDVTWNQQRQPTGRIFSVDRRAGYGANLRLGYIIRRAALLYGRLGAVRTEFRTLYRRGGVNVEQVDTQPGIRIGGGVELPASNKVFVRLDYSYTHYEDYDLDYLTGIDNFRNSESVFQLGLGYRF